MGCARFCEIVQVTFDLYPVYAYKESKAQVRCTVVIDYPFHLLDDLSSTASCNCQLKTRKRRIQIGDCVSFNEHNENYCEGFCETSVYPTYTSTEDARKCCSPGVNSVKSVILMRCNELGHEISRAVEVDAIRSCECHLC